VVDPKRIIGKNGGLRRRRHKGWQTKKVDVIHLMKISVSKFSCV
jgi:hypothetical protein